MISPICDPRKKSNIPDVGAAGCFVAKIRWLCKQHYPKEYKAGFQLRPARWVPQMGWTLKKTHPGLAAWLLLLGWCLVLRLCFLKPKGLFFFQPPPAPSSVVVFILEFSIPTPPSLSLPPSSHRCHEVTRNVWIHPSIPCRSFPRVLSWFCKHSNYPESPMCPEAYGPAESPVPIHTTGYMTCQGERHSCLCSCSVGQGRGARPYLNSADSPGAWLPFLKSCLYSCTHASIPNEISNPWHLL